MEGKETHGTTISENRVFMYPVHKMHRSNYNIETYKYYA